MGCCAMDLRHMTAGTARLSEQDRGAVLDQLKDAYTDGILDHDELDRRMGVVLSATDGSQLDEVVEDLHNAPAVIPKDKSWRTAGLILAASAVGVVVYVGLVLGASSPPSPEGDTCISTGISSVELECPAPTAEQAEIDQRADVASNAAAQAEELAAFENVGPNAEKAAEASEAAGAAAAQARQAVREGQAIMADALGEEPAFGAFDDALASARSAARDAVQALNAVEVAIEG